MILFAAFSISVSSCDIKTIGTEQFDINVSKKVNVSISKSFDGSSKNKASGLSHSNFNN